MKENRMKSSQRKKEGEKEERQGEGGETEKDTERKEHKARREKHSKKKKGKKHKALKDRNISVEINSKKKMRGAAYWKGKGLFGIGQNGFEKLMITIEIVQRLGYFHLC